MSCSNRLNKDKNRLKYKQNIKNKMIKIEGLGQYKQHIKGKFKEKDKINKESNFYFNKRRKEENKYKKKQ